MKSIVPSYIWPGADDLWAETISSVTGPGSHFIINPNSGPLPTPSSQWARRIDQLLAAGHRPIAYVPVGFGDRASEAIDIIGVYARQYPTLTGVFLDEFPAEQHEYGNEPAVVDRLSAAILLARRLFSPSRNSMDAMRVIANAGRMPSKEIVEALPRIGVWVTHENRDMNGPSTKDIVAPVDSGYLETKRQAWLSYNDPNVAGTMAELARVGWSYGYTVSDPAPSGNPWDRNVAT